MSKILEPDLFGGDTPAPETPTVDDVSSLRPALRDEAQASLFGEDVPLEDWRVHWWGMPSFEQGDARPVHRITVNFMSPDDVAEFAKRLGVRAGTRTDSLWYPPQVVDQPNEWEYAE